MAVFREGLPSPSDQCDAIKRDLSRQMALAAEPPRIIEVDSPQFDQAIFDGFIIVRRTDR